ncbi:MAG: hypothetical protein VX944_08820 [Myxococcota bacterium]|nr:hypothetical protein [Myxococcota bacterium]MEC9390162.1 hypothetical protein [Myxococcota bacterium]
MNKMLTFGLLTATFTGCDALDELKDALDDGPKTSYCESLCEWATGCAEGVSELTAAEMAERCDEATHEADAACSNAEAGDVSIDEALLLAECTDAVAEMSCDGLVGDEEAVLTAIPPVNCAGYGADDPEGLLDTYNAARNAVMQTGAELCESVVDQMCGSMVACLIGDHDVSEGEAFLMEQCTDTAFGAFETQCAETGLYDQTLPIDANPNRWAVTRCLDGFETVDACDVTAWPAECAAAFTPIDGEDLSGLVTGAATDFLGSFIGG